ncbi:MULTISPECIES: fimbrial protein [unclassified Burkholderia]|uniref:fimbrial protein n=1 Tax=unclassified Burkholderia TaxID=2613784 RepID=UPI001E59C334|nr:MULTISPECIES: fimbrial protein [unclassified Burkholderia]UEP27524.1 fimbrial protein [Burkholderia sp. B21-007]UEP41061.1 fimbrial protein [Burkholderia sp. B21-005]
MTHRYPFIGPGRLHCSTEVGATAVGQNQTGTFMKWWTSAGADGVTRRSSRHAAAMTRCARFLMLCPMLWSGYAFAGCQPSYGYASISPTLPASISVTQDGMGVGIQFPSSSPAMLSVGEVADIGGSCMYDEFVVSPAGVPIPNVTYKTSSGAVAAVFETGIPGVGYAMEVRNDSSGSATWVAVGADTVSVPGTPINKGILRGKVTYVAAGPVATGSYTSRRQVLFNFRPKYKGNFVGNSTASTALSAASMAVVARTCKIASGTSRTVPLPSLYAGSLKSVGDVAPARSAPFSFDLRCDADLNIYATLSDVTNPSNTGNVLSLGRASTASGVGIQILKRGTDTPLRFGPDSSAKGNTNQWSVGRSSTANTMIQVPFEARYVKTAEKITPGTVEALGTITFSYQ